MMYLVKVRKITYNSHRYQEAEEIKIWKLYVNLLIDTNVVLALLLKRELTESR